MRLRLSALTASFGSALAVFRKIAAAATMLLSFVTPLCLLPAAAFLVVLILVALFAGFHVLFVATAFGHGMLTSGETARSLT